MLKRELDINAVLRGFLEHLINLPGGVQAQITGLRALGAVGRPLQRLAIPERHPNTAPSSCPRSCHLGEGFGVVFRLAAGPGGIHAEGVKRLPVIQDKFLNDFGIAPDKSRISAGDALEVIWLVRSAGCTACPLRRTVSM